MDINTRRTRHIALINLWKTIRRKASPQMFHAELNLLPDEDRRVVQAVVLGQTDAFDDSQELQVLREATNTPSAGMAITG
ncbi:MAG: hypothetical protein AAF799_13395 [Myxococcota bacterium]